MSGCILRCGHSSISVTKASNFSFNRLHRLTVYSTGTHGECSLMNTIRIKRVIKHPSNPPYVDGAEACLNGVWLKISRDMTKTGKPLGVFTIPGDEFISLQSVKDLKCDVRVSEEFEVLHMWTDPKDFHQVAIIKTSYEPIDPPKYRIVVKHDTVGFLSNEPELGWEDAEEPVCYLLQAVQQLAPIKNTLDEFRAWAKANGL